MENEQSNVVWWRRLFFPQEQTDVCRRVIDARTPERPRFSPRSSEKSQLRWGRRRLETEVCVAGHQSADPEVIQNYVKKVRGCWCSSNQATDVTVGRVQRKGATYS